MRKTPRGSWPIVVGVLLSCLVACGESLPAQVGFARADEVQVLGPIAPCPLDPADVRADEHRVRLFVAPRKEITSVVVRAYGMNAAGPLLGEHRLDFERQDPEESGNTISGWSKTKISTMVLRGQLDRRAFAPGAAVGRIVFVWEVVSRDTETWTTSLDCSIGREG